MHERRRAAIGRAEVRRAAMSVVPPAQQLVAGHAPVHAAGHAPVHAAGHAPVHAAGHAPVGTPVAATAGILEEDVA